MNLEHLELRLDAFSKDTAVAEPPWAFLAAVRRRRRIRRTVHSAPIALLVLIAGGAWVASTSTPPVTTHPRDGGLVITPSEETNGFPTLAMLNRLNAAYDLDDVVLPAPEFKSAAAPAPRAGFGHALSAFNSIGF